MLIAAGGWKLHHGRPSPPLLQRPFAAGKGPLGIGTKDISRRDSIGTYYLRCLSALPRNVLILRGGRGTAGRALKNDGIWQRSRFSGRVLHRWTFAVP